MLAIREHIMKSKDPNEAKKNLGGLRVYMRHFEEALKRVKPMSQRELEMYRRISEEFAAKAR